MNSVIISKQNRIAQGAAMLRACRDSGLLIQDWCRENGISKDKYYYWKRKLKDMCIDSIEMPSFIDISGLQHPDNGPVSVQEAAASVTVDGIRIDIYGSATTGFLKNLVEAVKDV